jgi:hypothetical protein
MMTEYSSGCVWTCDACGLESEDFPRVGPGSVVESVAELRSRGWLIGRIGGEWSHYCANATCRKARADRSSTAVAELLDRPLRSVK